MVWLSSVPRWQQVIKHVRHAAELLAAVNEHAESSARARRNLTEHGAVTFPEAYHATEKSDQKTDNSRDQNLPSVPNNADGRAVVCPVI